LLAVSVFIPEQLIKKYWLNCVRTAFNESGVKFKASAVVVNLKKVNSIEAALSEVCKYITKSESWSQIPKAHLLEIANVKRFPRMFELTGRLGKSARLIKAKKEFEKQLRVEMKNVANTGADYLDKNDVTDGNNSKFSIVRRKNWRDLVSEIGLQNYLVELESGVTETMRMRREVLAKKYPLATFKDHTGFVWHDPQLGIVDEISPDAVQVWETSPEFLAANVNHYRTRAAMC
jgi:hypothetical protein